MTDLDKIITALEDMKATNLNCLDIGRITSMADHMIIVTGTSTRHNRAMMQALQEIAPELSYGKPRIEGDDYCQWILVNFGDVIVHIMLADMREYYAIEKLWSKEL